MLKFRMSNSMKAKRAAEAQRRAVEDKLKMEWAWKPMAAVMNEKESDLVYWVPPLYTSNLLTSFSSASSLCSSLSSSPSSSMRRASVKRASMKLRQSSIIETSPSLIRRKKLARRRAKLSPEDSIQEDEELPAEEKKRKDEPTTDDDKESGIHDEFFDSSSMDDEVQREDGAKTKIRTLSRQSSKSNKCFAQKQEKFRHIPTLLKVINKLSTIYSLPTRPTPIVAARRLERRRELRRSMSSTRRPKRPSVKIYSVPPLRTSMKKGKLTEENAKPDPYYVITRTKSPFGSRQQSFSEKSTNNRTHIGLPTLSESELRNAHLEMILKILANLYEEKIVTQSTEISQLKSKLQGQEKVVKQTARAVLDVQEKLKTLQAKFDYNEKLQRFYKKEMYASESSFPYHPLESLPEEASESSSHCHPRLTRALCSGGSDECISNLEPTDMNYLELSQNSSPSSFEDSMELTPSILISVDKKFNEMQLSNSKCFFESTKPIDHHLSVSVLSETNPVDLKEEDSQRRASTPIGVPRSILKTSQTRSLDMSNSNPSFLTSTEFDSTFFSSGEIPLSPFTPIDCRQSLSDTEIPSRFSPEVNKESEVTVSCKHFSNVDATNNSSVTAFMNPTMVTSAEVHFPPSRFQETQPEPSEVYKSVLVIEVGKHDN